MRVEEVKLSQRKKGRFLVKLENGDILRVTEEELLRFGLRRDMELDEEILKDLRAPAGPPSPKAQAASIMGSGALSRRELEKRLVRKGNDEADAQAAADWLENIGGVDAPAYAAAVVRDYGRRGYGPAKVREEVRHRAVPRELWDAAMEELPDSGAVLDALIQKKCRGELSDPREIKRVSDSLLRRGFSWGEVRSALSRYTELAEE